MAGLYDTTVLDRVVDGLKNPTSFLLDLFFPRTFVSDREEIAFDVVSEARRISPFVHPLVEGRMVEDFGFTTNVFTPAYVKDKRALDSSRPLKRWMGETIGAGNMSPAQRERAMLAAALADQAAMLTRREEVMASEALRLGTVTVTGDGYPTVTVNFGRAAGHTVTLSSPNRWGDAGIEPLDDIETWSQTVLQESGAPVTDCVMDVTAWQRFVASSGTDRIDKLLDNRRAGGMTELDITGTAGARATGGMLKGTIGGVRYWVHQDWYVNDAGSEVPILPANTVILGSTQLEGVRCYGAIRDTELGFRARRMATKSWTVPDPSVRYLLAQSAPLVVPERVNASFAATVFS